MNITLNFNIDDINALLTALGKLPYVESASLIQAIHNQAVPQITVKTAEEPEASND
jgi:hypothetical protein